MSITPNEKPWWAPDAQGFLASAIVSICGLALFVRMFRTSAVDDKMLDTMITILFSTCLVTVYNYSFGSSRGSQIKDDAQNKIIGTLTGNGNGSVSAAAAAALAAPAAAAIAAPPAAAIVAPPAAAIAAPPAAEAAVNRVLREQAVKAAAAAIVANPVQPEPSVPVPARATEGESKMAKYQGKNVRVREARQGDADYVANTDQVVVTLDDGTEKTVKRSEVTNP